MCGIAGFCHMPRHWKENISAMNYQMRDRGPDSNGIWHKQDNSLVLGHTRLAVLDMSQTGSQPMVSSDGRYVLVLNGEIYNFKEIRKKLAGTMLRGTSDTEVFLEAVARYGIREALRQASGMFALGVYDRQKDTITLARDRMGEKPLYYGYVSGCFIFASDLKAVRAHEEFCNSVHEEVLPYYLTHKYIPAPYTIYQDIFKALPGTCLTYDLKRKKLDIGYYWDLAERSRELAGTFKGSYGEAKQEFKRLLQKSVKAQMVADVPFGAFLSGGKDSSLVVAAMQEQSARKIKTFTIGFPDRGFDEAGDARKIARHLGTDHTELYVRETDFMDIIPRLPTVYGEPFGDTSQLSTYLVCNLAKRHVTVALSGDGGDELFCGYNSYRQFPAMWDRICKIPWPARKLASSMVPRAAGNAFGGNLWKLKAYAGAGSLAQLYENAAYRLHIVNQFTYCQEITGIRAADHWKCAGEGVNGLMAMDMLSYLPDDILVKVDRAAMAQSLETRVPLLDKDLVEFALSLPIGYKYADGVQKRIMRDTLCGYLPKRFLARPKHGFEVPVQDWLRGGRLREWAEETLDYGRKACGHMINFKAVGMAWGNFTRHNRWIENIWYLLVFLQWHQHQYMGKRR